MKRRLLGAHPIRASLVIGVLLVVGWFGATHTGRVVTSRSGPAAAASQPILAIARITNNAPEEIVVRLMTGIDLAEWTVPARSELQVLDPPVACPAGAFELQISLWRPNGDLLRDQRIPDWRCPDGAQDIVILDKGDYYRPAIIPTGGST